MRYRFAGWMGALGLAGCLRDPDPGGQEGEEVRGNASDAWEGVVDEGDTGQAGTTDHDTADSGADEDSLELDASDWVSWSGTLRIERGQSTDPLARDCVLVFQMEGNRLDDCEDCLAAFTVTHTLDAAASVGREACTDLPGDFSRTYAIVDGTPEAATLNVLLPDGSSSPYAVGLLEDGALRWVVGSVEVPATSDAETVYRTDAEVGVVSLD